jgi:benzoyl-CoA reductase/2-hydroxyglutaryl-CoA dehydratase subunit BcrC/BadD/HgdB
MKLKHYFEAQDHRWHEHYLNSEKLVNELEEALRNVEALALQHIADEQVRDAIKQIVNHVWRGARS